MAVELLPVKGKPSGHFSQKMGGQMRDFDPAQNKKAGVIGQKMQILLALLL